MYEFISRDTNRKHDGLDSVTRLRMIIAFIAGMVITAVLAQIPVVTDIFSPRIDQDSVIPAPVDAPDFLKSGGSYPAIHINYELVYAPLNEATFSG